MNMHGSMGALDFVVMAAILFAAALCVAWLLSPTLRVWIERPKYRFLANVEGYDRARREIVDGASDWPNRVEGRCERADSIHRQ